MALTINTNMQSLNSQRALTGSQSSLSTSMARLSSGLRVNSAKDDAAGLAISERMNAQVKGMNVAIRNANDAISMAQTAEGALGKIGENLQRMRELAVQAANATNGTKDIPAFNKELAELDAENKRIATSTQFNGQDILTTAAAGAAMTFQVGANSTDTIDVTSVDAEAALTTMAYAALTDGDSARDLMDSIDTAMDTLNSGRATLGAVQNRFEAVVGNLQIASENAASARGRIVDADFAAETANLSRSQILQQAGTAMLAQANQLPQNVLSLLR
mgnify:CR=1 FL=1